MYNKEIITKQIKNKSREIGFDLVGITTADSFPEVFENLKKRNLSNFIKHNLKLLTTPKLHLSGAKSIISLGISYASSKKYFNEDSYIALYARGKDYHSVIKEKINLLIEYISKYYPEIKMKAYTDSPYILEKEIAFRAGLGWIGKNNILINPLYGSYLLLGEIIIDIELKYDERLVINKCGDCTLCLDNCPGGALEKPHYLNYQNCVSYLTQKPGLLNKWEREKIDNNLWGCDKCLEICPYNRNIPVDLHPEFYPVLKGHIKGIINKTEKSIE